MTRAALIIEDDPTLAELVRLHLRDVDCEADIADDGVTGFEMFKRGDYELVVLDIMVPRKVMVVPDIKTSLAVPMNPGNLLRSPPVATQPLLTRNHTSCPAGLKGVKTK